MSHSQEQIYLLTIRGTLAPPSLEAARQVHNQTAGAPEGVAAAKSLGDLSHMVYVPVNKELAELFIMDLWTSPSGLNQFFSDPQVQQGAAMIFTQRDPVVWSFRGRFMKSKQARKEKRGRTSKKTSHVTTIPYQCDLKRSIGGVRCLIRTHYGNGNRQCQGTYRT